jgi:tRNA nucleotidyltransferase/poly(A) polymerase
MATNPVDPVASREFATAVVTRLRGEGHETYWAGGCVRDELLARTPADYDVATAATPDMVRNVFGSRRTLAVGAAFGVITVLGPRGASQVEVATFRSDANYTDGRRPASVTFCSAREDAKRRDFTINGLFLDPASGEVHDFVGGREDLEAGIVRAIGVPSMRFAEDHLRMLRAVRFTAFFGFVMEAETRAAVERMAHLVTTVSPERIAAELRAMTSRQGNGQAMKLLAATGLAREILPEVAPRGAGTDVRWDKATHIIAALDEPSLPQALATLCAAHDLSVLKCIAARLRLSNYEAKAAAWLREGVAAIDDEPQLAAWPWSRLQPWVADPRAPLLADIMRARAACGLADATTAAHFSAHVARPRVEIDPPPLVTGDDLRAAGFPPGPAMGATLARIRTLQLDGVITTRDEAMAVARNNSGDHQ